jgi:hypothetical protein
MVMSWDLNAGKNQNIKNGHKSFERVEQFKYLGTTLTNQKYIQEEIKADLSHGMLAVIRCGIFCLPGFYPQI